MTTWTDEAVEKAWQAWRAKQETHTPGAPLDDAMRRVMTLAMELVAARGGTMTADDHAWRCAKVALTMPEVADDLARHHAAQGARVSVLEQSEKAWRKRVEAAADALADVAPGELARLDLVGRIKRLRAERDAIEYVAMDAETRAEMAEAELARIRPSGQVEDVLMRAVCTKRGGVYRNFMTESRACEHCGHAPVEIIPAKGRVEGDVATHDAIAEANTKRGAVRAGAGPSSALSLQAERAAGVADGAATALRHFEGILRSLEGDAPQEANERGFNLSAVLSPTGLRYPCSSTCTHDDAATPGHLDRVRQQSVAVARAALEMPAEGDVAAIVACTPGIEEKAAEYNEGYDRGAEDMRAACLKEVRHRLEVAGAMDVYEIVKDAIEGASQ